MCQEESIHSRYFSVNRIKERFKYSSHPIRQTQIPLRSTGFHYIQCHFFTSAILVNDCRGFAEITFKDLSFAAAIIIIDLSTIFEEEV